MIFDVSYMNELQLFFLLHLHSHDYSNSRSGSGGVVENYFCTFLPFNFVISKLIVQITCNCESIFLNQMSIIDYRLQMQSWSYNL